MLKKREITEIIQTGLILFVITAVAAGLLAIVSTKTAPIIEKNQNIAQQNAMKLVLPAAEGFGVKNLVSNRMNEMVKGVYQGSNNTGYVVLVSSNGYGGAVSLAVGVSPNGKVSGVSVVSQTETAGLGSKCTDEEFTSQFIGKAENITVSKGNAKENQINTISSATITSKAVTAGVNAALEAAKIAKEAQ